MSLPNDPVMLLSVVNTELRDLHASLEELCAVHNVEPEIIKEKLMMIDYTYDSIRNQFI